MIMKLNIVCSSICSVCSHCCLFQACRPITRLHAWIGQINKSSNMFVPLDPFVVFPVVPFITLLLFVFCYTSREFFLASSVLPTCKLPDVHRSLDTVWLKHLSMNFSYANMCLLSCDIYVIWTTWLCKTKAQQQLHLQRNNCKWPHYLHFVQ